MKNNLFSRVSKNEIVSALMEQIKQEKAILLECITSSEKKSPTRNIEAYEFALGLLVNVSDDVIFQIPANHSLSYNIGAIGETVIKHFLTNSKTVSMATNIETDIDRKRMNEVKVWSSVNRNPNALNEPYGFIAVSRNGVHYINKKTVIKYWNEFADKNGKKSISRKMLETIIEIEKPTHLKDLSEKLGF